MRNKLSVIFYITLGFAVGYLLDALRRESQVRPVETLDDIGSQGIRGMAESQNAEAAQPDPEQAESDSLSTVDVSSTVDVLESAESLQQINGIGPAYAKRLFESGIRSFAELAQTDVSTLANISKARSLSQVEGWVAQAAALVSK